MSLKNETTIHRLFDERGFSESFDFIGKVENGKQDVDFSYRCKCCGAVNVRQASYYLYRYPRLICGQCGASSDEKNIWNRTRECNEAMEYYKAGHSVAETAERFGVTKVQINSAAKARGLSNGRKFGEVFNFENNEKQRQEAIQRLSDRLADIGFEYLEGYTNCKGKAKVKCLRCGTKFERTVGFLRKGNVTCSVCQKRDTQQRREEERKKREEQAEIKKIEHKWYRLTHPPKDERREALLNQTGICEICGKPYTVREYIKSCGMRYARNNGVCSAECRTEKTRQIRREAHRGRRDSHRNRARKFGCEYDSSITLKKLVDRDGLRCAICGEMCDWNDHSWSEYSGPTYPSIDHIIPMSKGGGHVWNNVQVAHIICNSEKGDNTQEAV